MFSRGWWLQYRFRRYHKWDSHSWYCSPVISCLDHFQMKIAHFAHSLIYHWRMFVNCWDYVRDVLYIHIPSDVGNFIVPVHPIVPGVFLPAMWMQAPFSFLNLILYSTDHSYVIEFFQECDISVQRLDGRLIVNIPTWLQIVNRPFCADRYTIHIS